MSRRKKALPAWPMNTFAAGTQFAMPGLEDDPPKPIGFKPGRWTQEDAKQVGALVSAHLRKAAVDDPR